MTLGSHGTNTGLAVFSTTTVFGLAAATALIRLTLAGESWVGAEIVVPAMSGFGVVEVAPVPSLTNTSARLFPAAAAAASAASPLVRL